MKSLKTNLAATFLFLTAYSLSSWGATKNNETVDLTNVAIGYCEMGSHSKSGGSLILPDGANLYRVDCAKMLSTAAEKGYTSIVSTAVSSSENGQAQESFVLAMDSEPHSTALMVCSTDTTQPQEGIVSYNNGQSVKKNCAQILTDLKNAGYSIVPELTVGSTAKKHNHASYVFVKK